MPIKDAHIISESGFWSAYPWEQLIDASKGRISEDFVRKCWRNHYTKFPEWDGSNLKPDTEERRGRVLEVLRDGLVGKTVFEVGAGRGFYSKQMRKWGYEVTATDFAVGDIYYDMTKQPWDGQFDNVVAIGILHHIMNEKGILNAIRNIKQAALRRIIISVALVEKKPNNHTRTWPPELYYGLGELVREVSHAPNAKVMVFDAN